MKRWITDESGNRCSIECWGSEDRARQALASLKGCSGCSDCSRCSDCSDCSLCSDCSRCSRCSDCSGCSDCSRCSDCSGCSRCSDCSLCSGCSRCSRCSDCSDCWGEKDDWGASKIPIITGIHRAVYEAASKPDALDMATWHTCETTHCRAGWVVALAGRPGRDLESRFNTELAAMMIYEASGYKINPCRFYDSDEDALEDMRKLAEAEVTQ